MSKVLHSYSMVVTKKFIKDSTLACIYASFNRGKYAKFTNQIVLASLIFLAGMTIVYTYFSPEQGLRLAIDWIMPVVLFIGLYVVIMYVTIRHSILTLASGFDAQCTTKFYSDRILIAAPNLSQIIYYSKIREIHSRNGIIVVFIGEKHALVLVLKESNKVREILASKTGL